VSTARKIRLAPWVVWLLVALAFALGYWVHLQFSFELSLAGLRAWIQSWGRWAPLLFVTVLTFRQFLLLPSLVLLPVGGLGFGLFWGTLLGALGLFLSGILTFALGRGLGGERWRQKMMDRYPEMEARVETLGPWLVLAVMAYPGGPMTAVFWASGLTRMVFLPFAGAVLAGGVVRSFLYSLFGSALIEGFSEQFLLISAGMAVIFLVPLCFARVRRLLGFHKVREKKG
jgi:uncharacterized membrane protein YdjX (TVP38/TMEM64 family)